MHPMYQPRPEPRTVPLLHETINDVLDRMPTRAWRGMPHRALAKPKTTTQTRLEA